MYKTIITDILRWILWVPVRKTLSHLSPKHLSRMEKVMSFLVYFMLSGKRTYLTRELEKCYRGEWAYDRIRKSVRDSFNIYVGSQLRMFHLDRIKNSNVDRYVVVDGLDHLNSGLENGKGVIILNPHFGPFMMIMPALGHRGYKATQITLQGEPPWGARKGIDKRVYDIKYKSIEGNMPVKFINVAMGIFPLREAIKSLKNNEIVLYPSTGRGGAAFHAVNLMRRKSLLSLTPFNLALKTGASLLPAFVMCKGRRTCVRFEKVLAVEHDATEAGLAEKYALVLDSYIERYPEHFLAYLYQVHINTRFGEAPFFLEKTNV